MKRDANGWTRPASVRLGNTDAWDICRRKLIVNPTLERTLADGTDNAKRLSAGRALIKALDTIFMRR